MGCLSYHQSESTEKEGFFILCKASKSIRYNGCDFCLIPILIDFYLVMRAQSFPVWLQKNEPLKQPRSRGCLEFLWFILFWYYLLNSLALQPILPCLFSVLIMPQTEPHPTALISPSRWYRAAQEGRISSSRQLQCKRGTRRVIRTQSYKGTLIEKELLGEKIIRDWMQGFIREKRKRSRQGLSEETHSHILRMTTTLLC